MRTSQAVRRRPPGIFSALLTAGVLLWTAAAFWDLFGTLLWLALSLVTLVCWIRGVIAAAAAAREEGDRATHARGILALKAALVPLLACASLAVAVTDLPTRAAFAASRPLLDRAADSPSDDTHFAGVLPVTLLHKEQAAVYYSVGTSFPLTLEACGFVRITPGADSSGIPASPDKHLSGPWHTYCYSPWESPFP